MRRIQVLLEQAEGCLDAATDQTLRDRGELLEFGLTPYILSQIIYKLSDAVGEIHKCRRMLPSYNRPNEED